MFYLLEVTLTDKEQASIYNNFDDKTALTAEFDTKMGQAMKTDLYKAELLVAFSRKGEIISKGFIAKDSEYTISPRLVWVIMKNGEESFDQRKCNDMNDLGATFYLKRGAAKKDFDVDSITQIGIDGSDVVFDDYWSRALDHGEQDDLEEVLTETADIETDSAES